jgi:DNA-binding transcriptional LysR family regulator
MTLVQLRHFVVLADLGSFVQASKALYLTQPALTRSIQSLEDELGGRLFDRLGRRIALTPFGSEALQRARRLVADAEALKQTGKGLHAGLIGSLRIGLSSGPGALLSTPLMLHMAQHHPRLHLQISRGNTAVLIDELREQHLDAAVVDVRSVRPAADLQVAQAFELPAGFLVRPGHPLKQTGRPVTIDEVLAHPVASTPLSDEVARILIGRYGPQANPDDMVTLRSDETLNIVEVAAPQRCRRADRPRGGRGAGAGWTWRPRWPRPHVSAWSRWRSGRRRRRCAARRHSPTRCASLR